MLEDVRMPLFKRQRSTLSDRLKYPEELRPVELPAFLRSEEKIASIIRSPAQPSPNRGHFLEQGLATVFQLRGSQSCLGTRAFGSRRSITLHGYDRGKNNSKRI
jgi:hypothetical protein